MRKITGPLFTELKSQTSKIAVGWLIVRKDATRYAFTSADAPFTYNGDTYSPTNGFNPSAIVSKADFSVDNMECQVLDNELITDVDLRAGLWDLATVKVFWLRPDHPEWGVVPLRGGNLGEITIKDGQWTTQLRSLFQQLQQPFGYFYSLVCMAQLGDARCKVNLTPATWAAHTTHPKGLLTDAGIGTVVKPTVYNGFWYVADYTTRGPSYEEAANVSEATGGDAGGGGGVTGTGTGVDTPNYHGDMTLGAGSSTTGTPVNTPNYHSGTAGGGDVVGGDVLSVTTSGEGTPAAGQFDAGALRQPSKPGAGLSGNDDLGPNDNTQVAVGAPNNSLSQFDYTGQPVDIFGIKI